MFAVTIFLCALGLINAYDFEDHAYNKLLVEQLSLTNPRIRRDTGNQCLDQTSCCNDDAIQNYHGSDKELSEQCYKELNTQRGNIRGPLSDEQKNQIKCVVECIGKKKGYLNADGELIKDVLLNDIKSRLQTVSWLVPKLDAMFERCLEDAKKTVKEEKQCNDIGLTVGHCIWKQIQLECPVDQQQDKEKCAALQDYLRQNKRFPPPPPLKC